jgi:hypothetical protein
MEYLLRGHGSVSVGFLDICEYSGTGSIVGTRGKPGKFSMLRRRGLLSGFGSTLALREWLGARVEDFEAGPE